MEKSFGPERQCAMGLLSGETDVSLDDARFSIEKSDRMTVYKNGLNRTVGCGTFRLWGEKKDRADVYLYVLPGERGAGIGKLMLNELINTPQSKVLRFISTRVETDHARSLSFYRTAGFESWYTELILCNLLYRQPECDLTFTGYRPEFFERYVAALRRSFFELRSANDFQPYNCCEPDDAKRNELEQKKDNIFVLLDGETIAASVIVNPDSIEDVFVVPEYQGKGIGKKLMWFALNKAIDSGAAKMTLSAIKWNSRALNLYESVGFRVCKEIEFLRLFAPGGSSGCSV